MSAYRIIKKQKVPFYILFFLLEALICLITLELFSLFLLPKLDFSNLPSELELKTLEKNFIATTIPNLFFVPKPNSPVFNSLGLCDFEYPVKKNNNVIRILVLGDSITQGDDYVLYNETFHEVLEKSLNKSPSSYRYEVWNCGVRKYNTLQEFLYFKHYLLQYNPDIVILAYLEQNDYAPPRILYNSNLSINENCYIAMVPKILPFSDQTHNKLCRLNLYKIINLELYKILEKYSPEKHPPIVFKNTYGFQMMQMNRKALFNLHSLCEDNEIKFLMVVFPLFTKVPIEKRDFWIYNTPQEAGIETCYLLPFFLEKNSDLSIFRADKHDSLHPGSEGHKIAAQILKNKLYDLKWIQ